MASRIISSLRRSYLGLLAGRLSGRKVVLIVIMGRMLQYNEGHITAATGLFCRGGKIDSRLLKFCQSYATPLSGTAKCDLAKFKQRAVTFCLLVKIVRPRQCMLLSANSHVNVGIGVDVDVRN